MARKSPSQLQREIAHALKRTKKPDPGLPDLRNWKTSTHKIYGFETGVGRYEIVPGSSGGHYYHLTLDAKPSYGGVVHELGTFSTLEAAAEAAAEHYVDTF